MSSHRKKLLAVFAIGAVAAAAWGIKKVAQQSEAELVYRSKWTEFTSAAAPSFLELQALNEALLKNQPIPSVFTATEDNGLVKGVRTGLLMAGPPAEEQIVVTVVDDIDDIDTVSLWLGMSLLYEATRFNGGIVDRGVKSVATLPGFVPQSGPMTLTVRWISPTGVVNEEKLSF